MKKALSLILTAVMLLSIFTCVPVVAHALDLEGTCGENVTYTFDTSTGLLTLDGTGATWNYYKDSPFYEKTAIKKVIVGSGVTKLGTMLFRKCAGLKTVDLSGAENLVSIGDSAFEECTSLTRIINPLSPNFKYIYSGAFFSCTSLKSYRLPNDLEIIDDNTFNDCRVLESITIPATVTKIENYAFHRCYKLKDIYFEGTYSEWNSITIEGDNTDLSDVQIHYQSTCDFIGDDAMYVWDSFMAEITITGTGATYDYNSTEKVSPFANSSVYRLNVSDGIQTLGTGLFAGCADLEEISFPETLTGIKANAFNGCNSIAGIMYQNGSAKRLNAITDSTGNSALLNAAVSTYGKCGENLTYIFDKSAGMIMIDANGEGDFSMYNYTADTVPWKDYKDDIISVYIADYVISIGNNAFRGCKNLTEVTFAEALGSIGENAFDGCTALETVNFGGTDTQWDNIEIAAYNAPLLKAKPQCFGTCGENLTFRTDHSTGTLYIEGTGAMYDYTSTSMPWYAFKEKFNKVVVANGVTTIGENAFWNCRTIERVTLGNTVQSIGKYAFGGCESLESVNLPNSLTSIGGQAFGNCESLESIAIPSGVTSLAGSTFASCTALKTITLPTTLTKIGVAAFSRCFGLQTVNYAGTQEDWNAVEILDSNDPLLAVKPQTGDVIRTGTCGENVTYILNETTGLLTISGTGAMYDYELVGNASPFNNNPKIKEIVVESGVTNIGNDAFTQLTKLEKVSLSSTVTSLGKDAFAFCFLLADINIPESVQSIGKEAFSACYALTSITIPKGVTTIEKSTFWHCDHLQSVTLPKSLESVSDNAFVYCSALTDVFYEGTASDWNAVTISSTGNDPLLGATMHYGATDFAAIRYKVPAFNGTNTTLTFKSESMTLTVSAADGNFEKNNVQSGVYKVYAKQKNALTIYLGEYDTASGVVTNTGAITLPLGDVNGNDAIGIDDISLLLATANYGKINTEIDLTGDRYITATDIALTLKAENYGKHSAAII